MEMLLFGQDHGRRGHASALALAQCVTTPFSKNSLTRLTLAHWEKTRAQPSRLRAAASQADSSRPRETGAGADDAPRCTRHAAPRETAPGTAQSDAACPTT